MTTRTTTLGAKTPHRFRRSPEGASRLSGATLILPPGWGTPIVRRPKVMGGAPTIAGTRVRVSDIVGYRRLGYSKARLRRAFPHLTDAQIKAALDYYERNQAEIDAEIAKEESA